MVPVMVVVVPVRAAVVGVRARRVVGSRSVIISRVVSRPVIPVIGMRRRNRAGGQRAGRKTERQTRPYAARLSSRSGERGRRNGADGRQNCQCLFHAHILQSFNSKGNAARPRWLRGNPANLRNLTS